MRRSLGVRGLLVATGLTAAVSVASLSPASSLPSASSPSSGLSASSPVSPTTRTSRLVAPEAAANELLSLADLLANPSIIHPDIARQVDVDLTGLGALPQNLSAARRAELEATADGQRARGRQAHLVVVRRETRGEHGVAVAEVNARSTVLVRVNEDLASFALGTFVESSAIDLASFSTDTGPSPIPTLATDAEDLLVGARRAASAALGEAEAVVARLANELGEIDRELTELVAEIDDADRRAAAAANEVARLEPAFETALLRAPVVDAGFPVVVLDAYYRAALRTAEAKPWCEVRWDQLAGIGKVESGHGTFGGSTVGPDGRTDREILGPVLDGTRFASIPDTDGGRHDLDPVWDRAVGPMQFIPGSWVRYGADGNGDGEVDPHNMYDAALAAANHLCGTVGGLGDAANYQRALLGYNRSAPYGLMVMDFADRYRSAVDLLPTPTSVADPSVVSAT